MSLADIAVQAARSGTDTDRWEAAFALGNHIDQQLQFAELMRPITVVSPAAQVALERENVTLSSTPLLPGIPVPLTPDGSIDWDALRRVLPKD